MSGDQVTFRAIRVICAENGLQDWPQRGAEVTKRRRRFEPLIGANRRSSRTTDECPRKTRNTRKAESDFLPRMSRRSRMFGEQGTIRAIRVIRGENGLQDWPQRGAEGTKRSETVGFCHRVH